MQWDRGTLSHGTTDLISYGITTVLIPVFVSCPRGLIIQCNLHEHEERFIRCKLASLARTLVAQNHVELIFSCSKTDLTVYYMTCTLIP